MKQEKPHRPHILQFYFFFTLPLQCLNIDYINHNVDVT